jgi:hypothetical protein
MAEIEFGGLKFRGGRLVAAAMAISTLGGALWGGFEIYARYRAMEEKINSYVAPDLTAIEKEIALVRQDMSAVKTRVAEVQEITRDIREDTRSDAASLHNAIGQVDKRSRGADTDTRAAMRQAEQTIRGIISSAQERFDVKLNSIDAKLDALEARLEKKVQRALDNPLLKEKR